MAIKINPMIIKTVYDPSGKSILKNTRYDEIFSSMTKLGYFHLGYNNYFEALKPRFEAIIDLEKPTNQLLKKSIKVFKLRLEKL